MVQLVESETDEQKDQARLRPGTIVFSSQKLHLTSNQKMGEKKERKKKLCTPDTEACVPYLTGVQSSVTPNINVLGVTLDWTRVTGQVRQK